MHSTPVNSEISVDLSDQSHLKVGYHSRSDYPHHVLQINVTSQSVTSQRVNVLTVHVLTVCVLTVNALTGYALTGYVNLKHVVRVYPSRWLTGRILKHSI